jgi:hypothetical protein
MKRSELRSYDDGGGAIDGRRGLIGWSCWGTTWAQPIALGCSAGVPNGSGRLR